MYKLVLKIVLRWRLWRVCKKLGIKPYDWQKNYALGKSQHLSEGRKSGKTTAIMLRALILEIRNPDKVRVCSHLDPDTRSRIIEDWWCREYYKMAIKVGVCREKRKAIIGNSMRRRPTQTSR